MTEFQKKIEKDYRAVTSLLMALYPSKKEKILDLKTSDIRIQFPEDQVLIKVSDLSIHLLISNGYHELWAPNKTLEDFEKYSREGKVVFWIRKHPLDEEYIDPSFRLNGNYFSKLGDFSKKGEEILKKFNYNTQTPKELYEKKNN